MELSKRHRGFKVLRNVRFLQDYLSLVNWRQLTLSDELLDFLFLMSDHLFKLGDSVVHFVLLLFSLDLESTDLSF